MDMICPLQKSLLRSGRNQFIHLTTLSMNFNKSHCYFLVCFLLFVSCVEDVPPPVSRTVDDPVWKDTSGHDLARRLSILIQENTFREELKSSILKKFDGDYNTLWSFSPAGLENPISDNPLLQIAMPSLSSVTAEDWEPNNHIPVVVYRPPGVDLSQLKTLSSYENGIEKDFDITREPDALILVVSHNERVVYSPVNKPLDILKGRICLNGPILSDENNDFYLKEDVNNCFNETYTGGATGSTGCDRDQYARHDHVTRVKFANINVFRQAEHYLDGNPEVFFIITLGSKNPSGFTSLRKSFPSKDRSQWKDCGIFSCSTEWHDQALPTFNWDPDTFGNLVRYDWFEEDYSKAKVDLTLGLSTKISDVAVSGGVKITINEEDYFLDQDFVNYCDKANGSGVTYNTGKLYFTVNHQ
jgi:hypothetical protein